jgi:hypothetical protein
MEVSMGEEKVSAEEAQKKILSKKFIKPIIVLLLLFGFVDTHVRLVTPYVRGVYERIVYGVFHAQPPKDLTHAYLAGKNMRIIHDFIFGKALYEAGELSQDFSSIFYENARNQLLNNIGFLEYNGSVLVGLLSSSLDSLEMVDQIDIIEQINQHFAGYLENRKINLSQLFYSSYHLETAINELSKKDVDNDITIKRMSTNFNDTKRDLESNSASDVDIFLVLQSLQYTKHYYSNAKEKLKYWIPDLHVAKCDFQDISLDKLVKDQNRLEGFLNVYEFVNILDNTEEKKTWDDPINCSGVPK